MVELTSLAFVLTKRVKHLTLEFEFRIMSNVFQSFRSLTLFTSNCQGGVFTIHWIGPYVYARSSDHVRQNKNVKCDVVVFCRRLINHLALSTTTRKKKKLSIWYHFAYRSRAAKMRSSKPRRANLVIHKCSTLQHRKWYTIISDVRLFPPLLWWLWWFGDNIRTLKMTRNWCVNQFLRA